MLVLYRRVIFGTLTKKDLSAMFDMNLREKLVFAPLIVLAIFFGIYPLPLFDVMSASVANLVENYELALAAQEGTSLAQIWTGR